MPMQNENDKGLEEYKSHLETHRQEKEREMKERYPAFYAEKQRREEAAKAKN